MKNYAYVPDVNHYNQWEEKQYLIKLSNEAKIHHLIIKHQWLQKERILGKLMFDKSKVNDYVIGVYDKTVFMGYLDQDSITDDINKAVSPKIRRDLQLYKDGWENYSYVLLDKTNPNLELGKVHKPLPYIYFGQ